MATKTNKIKKYEIEYWYLSYPLDSYDYETVIIEALNPKDAIQKAKDSAPRYAKKFEIIKTQKI